MALGLANFLLMFLLPSCFLLPCHNNQQSTAVVERTNMCEPAELHIERLRRDEEPGRHNMN